WKKVIERAAMTERIDKVKIVLGQEIKEAIARREELIIQEKEIKTDIEMIDQINSFKKDKSIEEDQASLENQPLVSRRSEEINSLMEDIKETQEKGMARTSSN